MLAAPGDPIILTGVDLNPNSSVTVRINRAVLTGTVETDPSPTVAGKYTWSTEVGTGGTALTTAALLITEVDEGC